MSVQGFDHHIQRDIFMKLRQYDVARYADINIKTIESSQFMYHLKELISQGLVEKVERGRYRLTRKGIGLSQNFSSDKQNLTLAPLTYSLIIARSTKGRWLLVKRSKQPYIGFYGCLSGKVHMEESLRHAADREWTDFVGTSPPQFKYAGQISVLLKDGDEVATHIAGPVWFVDGMNEDWDTRTADKGELSWQDWKTLPYEQFIPGWKEIVEAIESTESPFLLDLELPL